VTRPTTTITAIHAEFRPVIDTFRRDAIPRLYAGGPDRTSRRRSTLRSSTIDPATSSPAATGPVRIDQWLHAVRLTATRSEAAAAIRGGHVTINGRSAKPASPVAVGDRVEAHLHRRERIVEVTRLIAKRVGPPIAVTCYVDHSPPPPPRDDLAPLFAIRDRGTGRPTKRDRRRIERLRGR
jgi:ribosome-associated heat shock protein Hsp15